MRAHTAGTRTMIHVAVLKPKYLAMLLSGEKTLECRLTRNRIEPHGRIRRGERVYFKESSGPFRATAIVEEIIEHTDLDESGILAIREAYGPSIGAPDSFWESKRTARFAVLVRFRRIEEVSRGPKMPTLNGRGWVRLPREEDPYPSCLAKRATRGRAGGEKPRKSSRRKGPARA